MTRRTSPSLSPFLLLSAGFILLSVSLAHKFLYQRAIAFRGIPRDQLVAAAPWARTPAVRITIGSLVDVPIEEARLQNNVWSVSPTKANHVPISASPGSPGNIIIYGHNKASVFGNIRKLKGGETVVMTLKGGATRLYRVAEVTEVDPSQTQFLLPTETETLTLYTCSGFLDSKRFIVRAVPIR